MKNKATLVVSVFLVAILVHLGFWYYKDNTLQLPEEPIVAVVEEVRFTPNEYENGYYGLVVTDVSSGRRYTINATGFMNLPLNPGGWSFDCIFVPGPQEDLEGKRIEFVLPFEPGPYPDALPVETEFTTCYEKSNLNKNKLFFRVLE